MFAGVFGQFHPIKSLVNLTFVPINFIHACNPLLVCIKMQNKIRQFFHLFTKVKTIETTKLSRNKNSMKLSYEARICAECGSGRIELTKLTWTYFYSSSRTTSFIGCSSNRTYIIANVTGKKNITRSSAATKIVESLLWKKIWKIIRCCALT